MATASGRSLGDDRDERGERLLAVDDDGGSCEPAPPPWPGPAPPAPARPHDAAPLLSASPPASCARRLSAYAARFRTSPWTHRLLVGLVVLQLVLTIGERAALLVLARGATEAVYVCSALIVMAVLAAYYGVHGVLTASYVELIAYRFAATVLLVRVALDAAHSTACAGATAFAMCASFTGTSAALFVATFALTIQGLGEIRWARFRGTGADPAVRALYATVEWFSAGRKADAAFATVSLLTAAVFSAADLAAPTAPLTLGLAAGGYVLEAAWFMCGDAAVKRASRWHAAAFWALSVAQTLPGVGVVLLDSIGGGGVLADEAAPVRVTIALFTLLGLVVRLATVGASVALYRSFSTEPYRVMAAMLFAAPLGRAGRIMRGGGGDAPRPAVGS